jgi:hypothetical protein
MKRIDQIQKNQQAARLLEQLKLKGASVKRNEWTVQYTGAKLADAAKAKIDFHEGRIKVWKDAKEKVMSDIRASGIEVNESLAEQFNNSTQYSTTQAYGPTVTIKEDLLHKLQEAHSKVDTHTGLVKQYQAWGQMMSSHPEAVFQLQHDDWMFFFGR